MTCNVQDAAVAEVAVAAAVALVAAVAFVAAVVADACKTADAQSRLPQYPHFSIPPLVCSTFAVTYSDRSCKSCH